MNNDIFDFSFFPVLETERLLLRRMTHEDADALAVIYGDPAVLRYIVIEPPCETTEQATWWIDHFDEQFQLHQGMRWAITRCENPTQLIGICGFYLWHQDHRRVDIGYGLHPGWWRQGYMTEAIHAVVRWCFDNLNLNRIQADCNDDNIGSQQVLLKVGFRLEGTWRESHFEYGRFVNVQQYGLLRREYPPH